MSSDAKINPGGKKRVLIVEDQAALRTLIRTTLEFEGYGIYEAADATDGLHMATKVRPDIMLVDVMMPGEMDGYMLCERVKASPMLKHTKVIILSARAQLSDLETGKKAGADAYMTKPFSPLRLIKTVEGFIKSSATA